ncbi:MAG: MBL fold metallo-hydrolase [Alphaproteobacteria bacterium]|nr:MBL fold metallo-hydrolase [Alphaproteobacteria bacterium]
MKGVVIPVTPFQQNCSLIWCERSMKGAVVDPGGDLELIEQAVAEHKIELERILVTHGHLDHASGVVDLAERRSLPVEGPHEADRFWIDQIPDSARRYGFPPARAFTPGSASTPGRWLGDGDEVTVGEERMSVLHCPGHTPGHIVFFHAGMRLAFVGDVLFRGSIGRTDFPRGNHADLIQSIRGKLWPLGSDVTFVPGHGPLSTFGAERESNPFVGDAVLGAGSG